MAENIVLVLYKLIVDKVELLARHATYLLSERFNALDAALKALSISSCVFSVLTIGEE